MRRRRTAEEVARLLREADRDLAKGLTVSDICHKQGIAETTYYRWRQQYALASISTVTRRTNILGVSPTWLCEPYQQSSISKPGHGNGLVGQLRCHQVGVVSPLVEAHDHFGFVDLGHCRNLQPFAEDRLGLSLTVPPTDSSGQETVERTGHQGDLQIEIDLQTHHRG